MSLQEFLIEEEELDVFQRVIGSQAFSLHLPIPPPLLAKDISLDRELAPQVFPQAIAEWKRRLGKKQWSEEENVCVQKYISAEIAYKRESYNRSASYSWRRCNMVSYRNRFYTCIIYRKKFWRFSVLQ